MTNNDNTELAISFSDSLSLNLVDTISNLSEVGLDALMEDGLLKDIPIIRTVISVFRIGHTIRERHQIKKLAEFLDAINKNIVDENVRKQYLEKLYGNPRKRDNEIEYVLLILDRLLETEKARILAVMYLSYIDDKISWNEFQKLSAVIERSFPIDIKVMTENESIIILRKDGDSTLRLAALGLLYESNPMPRFDLQNNELIAMYEHEENEMSYELTEFGQKFVAILKDYLI